MLTAHDIQKPAPDNMEGKTGQAYTAAQLITIACHGILNTQFSAPDPKPKWFDDLNAKLNDAKALANEWVNTQGPKVTSSIPLQVINFGSTYDAISQNIQNIVQAHPEAKGKDNQYVIQIKEIIKDGLIPSIEDTLTNIDSASTEIENWGKKLQKAHNALTSGTTNIQNLEISLKTNIDNMNNAIKVLHSYIDTEDKMMIGSQVALGLGIAGLVTGIALAPPLDVIAVGGIIGGSVVWHVMQEKVNENFKKIAKDQQEIAADQRQIVALKGLELASTGAVSKLDLASKSLSKFRTQWSFFQSELLGALSDLEKAEKEISVIMQGIFTEAAQNEWQQATKTANALANRKIKIESKTLPMDSKAA